MSDDKVISEPPDKLDPPLGSPSPAPALARDSQAASRRQESWPGPRQTIALIHGLYYVVTGLWAVLSPETFQRVTGPKTDLWLVMTMGILTGVIGLALGVSGLRRYGSPESVVLAVGAALAFMGIDVYYAWERVISRVYLVDAVMQLVFIGFWLSCWKRQPRSRPVKEGVPAIKKA